MEIESLPIIMDAMRKNEIARRIREWIADELTETHKEWTAGWLKMRQPAPVMIFAGE